MREEDVTGQMIESWVAEAEAGYDVEQLRRGRPLRRVKLHRSAFKHGFGRDDIVQAASWPQ